MSVICRALSSTHMTLFTKGAPEKVASLCLSNTLPHDFNTHLADYASKGYRVIALAYKELPKKFNWKEAQKSKRELVSRQ